MHLLLQIYWLLERLTPAFLKFNRIRAIAICVFWQDDRILVAEGFDSVSQSVFYRPVGGGIEFGETSQQAIIREVREELGQDIKQVQLLGTLENIFTLQGIRKHEIVFIYQAEFCDRSIYEQEQIIGHETLGLTFNAIWKSLDSFDERDRLVPDGLAKLLSNQKSTT
jgi:8-oxo-dGTP pyrophosphatase MutT (NUDIX family)